MAYTPIDKSSDYFNTLLYTGNDTASTTISGVGFQSDFTWIKSRTTTENHHAFDAVRGGGYRIYPNLADAQSYIATTLTSWTSDGFVVGTDDGVNANGANFVAWNWKANGAGATNEDGSINSTKTSASTTSGFSIVSYTGTNSTATVGHGLGVAPKMIIWKERGNTNDWCVWHTSLSATQVLILNTTAATASDSNVMGTLPTSSVFSIGQGTRTNRSSGTYIAYCFAEKQGFSKFGSYKGNGNNDGTFTYLGFKPAFLIIKRTDTGNSWYMYTGKTSTSGGNLTDKYLEANEANAEATTTGEYGFDFLSNGFKATGTGGGTNNGSGTYIYMAFAENPFVTSTGIPTPAR